MYHIVRLIIHRLWTVAVLMFFSCSIIFWYYGFILSFSIFLLGICTLFYCAQDLLLYYPNDPPDSREFVLQPSNYQLPYENIKICNKSSIKIHMFLIKQASNSCHIPTLVFFHGNAGNMGQRLHQSQQFCISSLQRNNSYARLANVVGFYQKLQINILMVEYSGYGLSEGSPSEKGLYIDAQSALDYIMQRPDIDANKIILFGRSLGGAIAIDLASRLEYKNKIWALIVENTFTSIPDMAKILLRWRCLKWLPKFVYKNKYTSIQKMSHVVAPTLIICGSNDLLVPPSMSKELYTRCGAIVKRISVMPGGGHDDSWTCKDYYHTIQLFLGNVPPLPSELGPYLDENTKTVPVHTV